MRAATAANGRRERLCLLDTTGSWVTRDKMHPPVSPGRSHSADEDRRIDGDFGGLPGSVIVGSKDPGDHHAPNCSARIAVMATCLRLPSKRGWLPSRPGGQHRNIDFGWPGAVPDPQSAARSHLELVDARETGDPWANWFTDQLAAGCGVAHCGVVPYFVVPPKGSSPNATCNPISTSSRPPAAAYRPDQVPPGLPQVEPTTQPKIRSSCDHFTIRKPPSTAIDYQ